MAPLPLVQLWLSIRHFRRVAELTLERLRELDSRLGIAFIRGADVFVDLEEDRAAIRLYIDGRGLSDAGRARLVQALGATGADPLDLSELSPSERDRFEWSIVRRFPHCRKDLPTLAAALVLLARAVGTPAPTASATSATSSSAPGPRLRFRRGDAWQPGRLVQLGRDGAFVATGGAPREGDATQLEIVTPRGRAEIPATVVRVTQPCHAETLGALGFAARFNDELALRRPAVHKVLHWASRAVAAHGPPPRRCEGRVPLAWPCRMKVGDLDVAVVVKDVSHRGLFIETTAEPRKPNVSLRIPFDQRDVPLRVQARVVRKITGAEAAERGLAIGLGLEVDDELSFDADRFAAFVSRAANRADQHIVIGAAGDRLRGLVGHFAASGYMTTGAPNAGAVWTSVKAQASPPELVLLDASLGSGTALDMLKSQLGRRKQPLLDIDSSPVDTRLLVDAALIGA